MACSPQTDVIGQMGKVLQAVTLGGIKSCAPGKRDGHFPLFYTLKNDLINKNNHLQT